MNRTHTFPSCDYMLEEYTAAEKLPFINFEGNLYSFVGERHKRNLTLHLYRSLEQNEQHYILVHMYCEVPFLIKTFYSIERITMPDIWRFAVEPKRKDERYDYQSTAY